MCCGGLALCFVTGGCLRNTPPRSLRFDGVSPPGAELPFLPDVLSPGDCVVVIPPGSRAGVMGPRSVLWLNRSFLGPYICCPPPVGVHVFFLPPRVVLPLTGDGCCSNDFPPCGFRPPRMLLSVARPPEMSPLWALAIRGGAMLWSAACSGNEFLSQGSLERFPVKR